MSSLSYESKRSAPTVCTAAEPERDAFEGLREPVETVRTDGTLDVMPNLGGPEIIVILLVALIFLGPQRLPEVGRQIGGALRELRRVQSDVKQQLDEALRVDSSTASQPAITSEPVAGEPLTGEPAAAHDAPPAVSTGGDADQLPPPTSFI